MSQDSAARATAVKARDSWSGDTADAVVLDFDDRHRRRVAMTGVRGLAFLLDLGEAVMLRGGDALVLDDGRLVEVVAAPEPLAEIRCADAFGLVRVAWHLGNRHLPVQIAGAKLRIRRDHVIEDMVRGLGGRITEIEAPFDPEGGAYAAEAAPGHDNAHPHGAHHHGHDHDHGHDHAAHRHDHGHAPHEHGHDHSHAGHAHRNGEHS